MSYTFVLEREPDGGYHFVIRDHESGLRILSQQDHVAALLPLKEKAIPCGSRSL